MYNCPYPILFLPIDPIVGRYWEPFCDQDDDKSPINEAQIK